MRIAYELQLNLVDAKRVDYSCDLTTEKVAKWCADEERRRIWWALWEFDVFACSIKLSPTAIDWAENKTVLPVDDRDWFIRRPRASCLLELDPTDRWKSLQMSGNESAKAWFLVVNSFMRNAHLLSDQMQAQVAGPQTAKLDGSSTFDNAHQYDNDPGARLSMLANSLSCFCIALPRSLTYKDEYLSFSSSNRATSSSLQNDSAVHSIHVMTQLTRFKIYHHEFFSAASREANLAMDQRQSKQMNGGRPTQSLHPQADSFSAVSTPNSSAWKRYLDAADSILTIVSNSSIDHIKYVNPFLACTIWIAAAVELCHRVFGPPGTNRRLMQSNFDRLRSNYTQYVTYWQTPCSLLEKLNTLGPRLERLRCPPPQDGQRPWIRPGPPRRTQSAFVSAVPQEQSPVNSETSELKSGYLRHSISIPKDMPSPFQPFLPLQPQQQDPMASFDGMAGMSWPNRFDDNIVDSNSLTGLAPDNQFESFDFVLSDNLDLPFSLANVLNWHSVVE